MRMDVDDVTRDMIASAHDRARDMLEFARNMLSNLEEVAPWLWRGIPGHMVDICGITDEETADDLRTDLIAIAYRLETAFLDIESALRRARKIKVLEDE